MSRRTLRAVLAGRVPVDQRERGSLPFLMLVMILSAALGAVLLSTVVSQARTTRFDQTRVSALDAAQAGLDYSLTRIRGAYDSGTVGTGDAAKLPCTKALGEADPDWDGRPVSGSGAAEPGDADSPPAEFSVRIAYYTTSPTTAGAKKMICAPGAGAYDPDKATRTPRYAVITSTGRDLTRTGPGASRGRRLETTYVFQTNDVNVSGGQIRIYPASVASPSLCLDAGSSPGVGTAVSLQPCSTSSPPAEQQVWSYRTDLSIELVSSSRVPVAGAPKGLCLDTASTPHAAGLAVQLKECGAQDADPKLPNRVAVCPAGFTKATYEAKFPGKTCDVSPYNQRWSVDDDAHLRSSNRAATDVGSFCLDVASQTVGTALMLQNCAGSTTDPKQTWVLSPTAGAGAAGAGNNQLVNFAQFATCIDITGQDVLATHQILYTCKQNPNPAAVRWNQKLTPSPVLARGPTDTTLTTGPSSNSYCLVSPGTNGGFPVLKTCSSATTGEKTWKVRQRYAANAANAAELSYGDRYTITDAAGRCLALGPNSDMFSNGQYYKLVVATCDGSTAQKWNADPSTLASSLQNTRELPLP